MDVNFFEVQLITPTGQEKPTLLNLSFICRIETIDDEETRIYTTDGRDFKIAGNLEKVKAIIREAKTSAKQNAKLGIS